MRQTGGRDQGVGKWRRRTLQAGMWGRLSSFAGEIQHAVNDALVEEDDFMDEVEEEEEQDDAGRERGDAGDEGGEGEGGGASAAPEAEYGESGDADRVVSSETKQLRAQVRTLRRKVSSSPTSAAAACGLATSPAAAQLQSKEYVISELKSEQENSEQQQQETIR